MSINSGFVSISCPLAPVKITDGRWRFPTDKKNVTMAAYYSNTDTLEDWRAHVEEIDDDFQDEIIKVVDTGKPLTFTHGGWSCTFVKTNNLSVEVTIKPNQTDDICGCSIITYKPSVCLDYKAGQTETPDRWQVITFGHHFGEPFAPLTVDIDGKKYVRCRRFTEVYVRDTVVSKWRTEKIFRKFWELHDGKLEFKTQAKNHSVVSIVDGFVCIYKPDWDISNFMIRHQ